MAEVAVKLVKSYTFRAWVNPSALADELGVTVEELSNSDIIDAAQEQVFEYTNRPGGDAPYVRVCAVYTDFEEVEGPWSA